MLKLFSAFAGYGTDNFALKQLGIDFECVGISEIDKYAWICFINNHKGFNYGDITKIDWNEVPDFDLLTGGFPCQDVSVAGKQDLNNGRTILGLELTKALKIKQPKYFLFENVKGLMSQRFKEFREKLVKSWEDCGYKIYSEILNTKDYGIPQSRARVFFVGIRKDIKQDFKFPEKEELKIFIKDILEKEVNEKYYLSELLQERFKKYLEEKESKIIAMRSYPRTNNPEKDKEMGRFQNLEPRGDGCSNSLTNVQKDNLVLSVQLANKNRGKIPYNPEDREMVFDINKEPVSYTIKQAQHEFLVYDRKGFDSRTKGFRENELSPTLSQKMGTGGNNVPMVMQLCGDRDNPSLSIKEDVANSLNANPMSDRQQVIANCLDANMHKGVNSPEFYYEKQHRNLVGIGRLRRLTPKECFRLQGFLQDEVNLAGLSDTQAYKLAGNGQSVNVIKKIFENLFVFVENKRGGKR